MKGHQHVCKKQDVGCSWSWAASASACPDSRHFWPCRRCDDRKRLHAFSCFGFAIPAVTRELLELLFPSETRWRVFLQPSPFQHPLQMYHQNFLFKSLLVHFQLLQSFRVFGQGLNPDHTELPVELLLRVPARPGSPVPHVSLGSFPHGCSLSPLAESHQLSESCSSSFFSTSLSAAGRSLLTYTRAAKES